MCLTVFAKGKKSAYNKFPELKCQTICELLVYVVCIFLYHEKMNVETNRTVALKGER